MIERRWVAAALMAAWAVVTASANSWGESMVVASQIGALAGAWRFHDGSEFPGAKGSLTLDNDGVLHLAYDFGGGGNYVAAYCDLSEPAGLRSVTFNVQKPAEASLTVRVSCADGQTFQKPVTYDHAGWQRLEFNMANWAGHWGGPDDGVFRLPVKTIGILVENSGLDSPQGEIRIASVSGQEAPLPQGAQAISSEFDGEYTVTDFGPQDSFGVGAHSSLQGGVWEVDFAQTDAASLHNSLSLLGSPKTLILTLQGPPGVVLSMGIGSHFQGFSRTIGALDGSEQTFTFPVPPDGWDFGGGENDGVARAPLRFDRLTASRGSASPAPAIIRLIALRCTTTVAPDSPITLLSRINGADVTGESRVLDLAVMAWNLSPGSIPGTLSITTRDWEGESLGVLETPWVLAAKGRRMQDRWRVTVPAAANFSEVEFLFAPEGVQPAVSRATFTKPLSDPGDAALQPESPWGMGVYLYRYADSPEGLAMMDRAAAMAQAAGVKWSREEFSWARTEPQQGTFDFSFYDKVVDTAHRHGISVYGLLSYWSNWTEPYTEKGIDDFCIWARETVRRFKGRIKHWEIYNEPNIFFWSGDKSLYPVLVKKCYAAIKEEDPEAVVLAISTAGIDRGFIRKCVEAGAPFDILTIHPYRGRLIEKGFMRELREAAALVDNRPVWITEMGWSTQIGGVDERQQAQLLARCYLAAVASGACGNVSWYDFRNDGNDPFYNEANFGALRADLTPKPAYRALATLCRSLHTGDFTAIENLGEGVYGLRRGDALAVWSGSSRASIAVRGGSWSVRNLMGDILEEYSGKGSAVLTLQPGCPLFIEGADIETAPSEEGRTLESTADVIRF